MERIGIAASKIAQGNVFLYNIFVIIISSLFSLFIFFISGCSILFALLIIGYILNGMMPIELKGQWGGIVRLCMVTLTVVVSLFNLLAISRNIKIKKKN